MKLKKVYSIEIPISRQEYETRKGKVVDAVDKLAETLGLQTTLVETKEIDEA